MKNYLKIKSGCVEKTIRDYLDEISYPEILKEGMSYALLNGGKRLRPSLLLMVLDLFEIEQKIGLPYAAAIEFIHTYSLVHDDLPALDNDDYRRGNLTVHKKYGEAQAILVGDALLTHAFYIMSKPNEYVNAEKVLEIINKTSQASGINGMVGGQFADIEFQGKDADIPQIQYIHTHKTGKMIRLPIEIALIITSASKEDLDVMLEYADLIGIAFQIKDDILDVEGEFEKLGKTIGKDKYENKATYPAIFGLERSKEMLTEKIERAKEIINRKYGEKGIYFIKLADYIIERDN